MTEPSIDEMLEFMAQVKKAMILTAPTDLLTPTRDEAFRMASAISAILEQRREQAKMTAEEMEQIQRAIVDEMLEHRHHDLIIIQSFVKMVQKHWPYADHTAMCAELEALEKETE